MSTLQELVRYCNEEKHLGALMLTGESGCGKTYLIEHDLTEELSETHFVVHVSLLGVNTAEELEKDIREEYLMVCTPFLGKLKEERDRHPNLFTAINDVLRSLLPTKGNIASAVGSVDVLDLVPLEPVVEDIHKKGVIKKVVLVLDDLNRTQLDWRKFVGIVNEFCEIKGFATIAVGDMDAFRPPSKYDVWLYKTVKEKTFCRTVRYTPDYGEIIHSIISQSTWQSEAYQDFLTENEEIVRNAFYGPCEEHDKKLDKYHHVRSLNCAMQEFFPLYEVLTELQVPEIGQYLYSFIVYMLLSRSGINRNGQPSFESTEEEIRLLYPDYRPELMPTEIRQWIEDGIWEKERIVSYISGRNC